MRNPFFDPYRSDETEGSTNQTTRYRKKPVEVEAIRFDGTGNGHVEVEAWAARLVDQGIGKRLPDRGYGSIFWGDYKGIHITTLEGTMTASAGDWIICGVQGEFYPCKHDVFTSTYEPVRDVSNDD